MSEMKPENERVYELRWADDEGHPDSIDFRMSDSEARKLIASHASDGR